MILQDKAEEVLPLGFYFHVPFCSSICDFCSFYQKVPRRDEIKRYLNGMELELKSHPLTRCVDTVFWGGGTPGLLTAKDLQRLGSAMLEKITRPPIEWTVELAPSTVKKEKLKVLRDLGVTRISMGVESFSDRLLKTLGRQHCKRQIFQAIDTINDVGIENINLDLIFSIPGQTMDDWLSDLKQAIQITPQHISTYCLTFEEDTALFIRLSQGKIIKKPKEEDALIYEITRATLEDAGYKQYEISNYAIDGFECLHNKNTWHLYDWIGFGPSAATQYNGRRFVNVASLEQWLEGIENGHPNVIDDVKLNAEMLAADCLIFGLRMNGGVHENKLQRRFPDINFSGLQPLWGKLSNDKYLEMLDDKSFRLTTRGLLVADSIAVEILEAFDTLPQASK
jgi:oxygen-independent coproporphyrinogen-3 oxidase